MKQIKSYLFLVLSGLFAAGCAMDEIVYPEADPETAGTYMTLGEATENPLTFDSVGGTYILKVVSEEKWTLTSNEEWCSPTTTEGFKYTQVSISFSDNPRNIERSAQLTFTLNETSETFTVNVTQEAAESSLFTDPEEFSFSIAGGDEEITVTSNAVSWTMEITGEDGTSAVDWCTASTETGTGSGTSEIDGSENAVIALHVEGNNSGSVRSAKAVFTVHENGSDVVLAEVQITQQGEFSAPELSLDSSYDFILSWDDIVGVDRYLLETYSDESLSVPVNDPLEIAAGTVTYDLANMEWKDGYVGMVYMRLAAVMTVEGQEVTQTSNTVSCHNYFDATSGDGTESSPYTVSSARHLRNIAAFPAAYYRQIADIDLAGIDFQPVYTSIENVSGNGRSADEYLCEFTGVYDAGRDGVVDEATGRTSGQYRISNMTINRTTNGNVGLFAQIGAGGIVRNLCMENPVVRGAYNVGTVAGECSGTILNCSTVAGASGTVYGSAADPAFAATFSATGGIAGCLADGRISRCRNTVPVSGNTAGGLGGIVGRIFASGTFPVVEYCLNTSSISMDTSTPFGGIVGDVGGALNTAQDNFASVDHCSNTGAISSSTVNNQVGGIIGRSTFATKVNACYNSGTITAAGSAGGIIGRMGGNTIREVNNCLNSGAVSSTGANVNNHNAAGIVAQGLQNANITMSNCLNTGIINANSGSLNGLVYNFAPGTTGLFQMTGCYALDRDNVRQTSASDSDIQTPASAYRNLSDAEASAQGTYTGWDFTDVWELANGMYPTLKGLLE